MEKSTLSSYLRPGVVLEGVVEEIEAFFRVISRLVYEQVSNLIYVNAV